MPRRCPKLGSNVATSSPARCSGKFPKGRARGNHARAGRPCRCRVPASLSRRLTPCASKTERPSGPRLLSRLSIAPLTPCLSLRSAPRRAAAMGVAAKLAAAASSLPSGFPECAITFSVMCRSPFTHCPVTAAAVTRRRRSACCGCRLNAWPRCLKLSQSKPWPPAGARGPAGTSPPLHRCWKAVTARLPFLRRRCRPLPWPSHLGPPLGHPRPPASAGGHPGAPPPLHRRR